MQVGFYDLISKFNPYHGKDGRFTSPGGATSFFIGGSDKQKANAKAKEMLRTWSNPERDKAIKNIANKTRNLKNEQSRIIDENGNILLEKKGNRNSVAMSVGEKREFMRGNTGVHNHPDGGTFSAADLRDFGFGAKEIIVASPEGDYSLKNVNFGNRKQYDGWTRMQEALERDVKPVSSLDLLKQARKNLEDSKENRELKEISDEWNRIKDKSGLDAAKEWYKGKQERYDELLKKQKDNVQAEVRRLEVAPHHEWLQQNASNYGFDYSFTPANNVKKSFETVLQKFNPNHDKLGRFAASGSSGTGSEKGTTYKLYHGSPNANISQFDISHSGENTQSGENLLFFTDSREFADAFSYERLPGTTMVTNRKGEKGRVYEVDVTMKKPLDFRNLSDTDVKNILKLSDDDTLTADEVRRLADRNHQLLKTYIDLQSGALKELGYDGLIADTKRGALEYAVVSNDQVKITKMTSRSFIDVIRKYNSVHDKLGRFASGHGALLQADKGTNNVNGTNVDNSLTARNERDILQSSHRREASIAHNYPGFNLANLMLHWYGGEDKHGAVKHSHADEYSEFHDKAEYADRAKNLINAAVGGDIVGYYIPPTEASKGKLVRFNKATGEYVKGNEDGIITCFKAKFPRTGRNEEYDLERAFDYYERHMRADNGIEGQLMEGQK